MLWYLEDKFSQTPTYIKRKFPPITTYIIYLPTPIDKNQPISYTYNMLTELRNPFAEIREQYGITQSQLAKDVNLTSDQIVRRTEQGLYSRPNPRVLAYLANLLVESGSHNSQPVAEAFLQREYKKWQSYTRKSKEPEISRVVYDYITGTNVIRKRRYNVTGFIDMFSSRMEFCRLLRINPAQLPSVATNKRLPHFIVEALLDCGIPRQVISKLNEVMMVGVPDPYWNGG